MCNLTKWQISGVLVESKLSSSNKVPLIAEPLGFGYNLWGSTIVFSSLLLLWTTLRLENAPSHQRLHSGGDCLLELRFHQASSIYIHAFKIGFALAFYTFKRSELSFLRSMVFHHSQRACFILSVEPNLHYHGWEDRFPTSRFMRARGKGI